MSRSFRANHETVESLSRIIDAQESLRQEITTKDGRAVVEFYPPTGIDIVLFKGDEKKPYAIVYVTPTKFFTTAELDTEEIFDRAELIFQQLSFAQPAQSV